MLLPNMLQAAPATTCKEMIQSGMSLNEISAGGATRAAVLDCKGRGDMPLYLRNQMGAAPIVTAVGNSHPGAPCRPGTKHQCPNTMRKYTDGSDSPPGYDPAKNPKFNEPVGVFGELNEREIPCGALTSFAQSAMQNLLGKAKINIPTPIAEINARMNKIQGYMNQLGGLVSTFQAGGAIPSNQANQLLTSIGSEISGLLGQMPVVGGAVTGLVNQGMGLLSTQVNKFINTNTATPQAEIDGIAATLNQHLGTVQGHLNTARSEVVKAQQKLDDATNGLFGDFNLKDEINNGITNLLSKLFKYKDCQNGKFWGILNRLFALVMKKGKHVYNVGNSTFISPDESYITLPLGANISFISQTGPPAVNFSLPNGGSFTDAKGYEVKLAPGVTPKFRRDGFVRVSDGNQYRVHPRQEVILNPNGIIGIPAKTRIPVDPKGKIYPMGAVTQPPVWYDDYISSLK
ncbi:MAG: hypothetical protein P8P30_00710 [Rickettsiales bacterium]|nr:hypothetical protein [Rickettsiales bacterium]